MRNHPFFQAPPGEVYAISITPEKWGFVRFFRGNAMAVLSIVGTAPEMPRVNWENPPIGWIFSSFAPRSDTTQVLRLGIVAFSHEDCEWAPPCFVPPDPVDNCYKIHHKSTIRRASVEEVQGMRPCRRITPAQLAEFLREKLKAGGLDLAY